jgi:hypothetical protein
MLNLKHHKYGNVPVPGKGSRGSARFDWARLAHKS